MQGCIKRVCTEFCKDAKQYKHTQTLTLREIGQCTVLLRRWKCEREDSGEVIAGE